MRVRRNLAEWRRIGASRKVLRWLNEGVRVQWENGPPPPFHHGVSTFSQEDEDWLAGELPRCLSTGAWAYAQDARFVSRAFVVTHNGKKRLVFNCKHVNTKMLSFL